MSVGAGPWYIDDLLTFYQTAHDPATGGAVDADSAPTYRVYEHETGAAILTGSMALLDSSNTAGLYSEQITLSAANGFEVGKSYVVYREVVVDGVTDTAEDSFKVIATPADAVAAIADAVWDEALSGHTTAGTAGKQLQDIATGSAPTAAAIADAVWDELLTAHLVADSGSAVVTEILNKVNIAIANIMTLSTFDPTASTVDGITYESAIEFILAVLGGVTVPIGSTVAFKKRDGLTTKVTITYGGTDGERTASIIT